jgi:hypothetical protein
MPGIVGIPVAPVRPIRRSQLLSARGWRVRKRLSGGRNCLRGAGWTSKPGDAHAADR